MLMAQICVGTNWGSPESALEHQQRRVLAGGAAPGGREERTPREGGARKSVRPGPAGGRS